MMVEQSAKTHIVYKQDNQRGRIILLVILFEENLHLPETHVHTHIHIHT